MMRRSFTHHYHTSGYGYEMFQFKARKRYRCTACGGWIEKGEVYYRDHAGMEKEHEICPRDPAERERINCREYRGQQ
jgi:hypothetical protein